MISFNADLIYVGKLGDLVEVHHHHYNHHYHQSFDCFNRSQDLGTEKTTSSSLICW